MNTETSPASGWARKILACLAILVVSVIGVQTVAATAVAAQSAEDRFRELDAPRSDSPRWSSGGQCIAPADIEAVAGEQSGAHEARLNYLPLNRWGGHTSNLHSRLGAKFHDDVRQKLSRDMMQSTMMSFGDALWSITGGLVTFASEYSVLEKAGCTADAASAALGDALLSGIVPIFAGAGIVISLWKARQGSENPTKKLASMVLTLGIFGVLLNGAQNTAATNTISPGSPGYIAVTLDGIVTAVAAAPTAVMNDNMPTAGAFGTSGNIDEADGTNCSNYIAELRNRYSAGGAAYNTAKARIPVAVSAMWEQSGLRSFTSVQFGAKNPYGQASYCRYLDRAAGIPIAEQQSLSSAAGGPSGGAPELYEGGNNNTEDQAGIFWAACQYNGSWSLRGDWAAVTGAADDNLEAHAPTAEKCAEVFANWGAGESESGFEWSDSADNIEKRTTNARAARDFMFSWHGDAVSNGLAVSFVYVASAAVVLLVFGLISVGIIIAKSVGVVMIVMIFLMLTMAFLPSEGSNNKLVKFFKFWLGMTFYSAGLMFILSLVALITAFVNQVGFESFGEGSLMSILWMGFAPVTAIVLLHVVFKHAVGIPSPFKPGAALAFGGTLAGAGGALGVGIDRMARRGRGMASGYGRGMASGRAFNRAAGEKRGKGRDQKMPVGGHGGAAAGAGAGAAGAASGEGGMASAHMGSGAGAGAAGSGDAAPSKKQSLRERLAATNDMGWGERARQAARVPKEALDRKKERWKSDGGRRRLIKRTGVAGAALTWAGIGGAATVAASTAAPLVAAAVGARALHRARDRYKQRVASGDAASVRQAAVARSNERVNEYRARLTARQEAADQAAAEPERRAAAAARHRRDRQEAEAAQAAGFDVPTPTDPEGRGGGFGGAGGPRSGRPDPDNPGDGDGGGSGSRGPSRGPGPAAPGGGSGARSADEPIAPWDPDGPSSTVGHSRRPRTRPVRPPR